VHVFWIDPTLAITTRPRGGDWLSDELSALKREGVSIVVSCLTDPEEHELGLAHEAQIAREQGLRFVRVPIQDRGTPANADAFATVVDGLVADRSSGRRIAVHCRQGLGRAPLVAASILVGASIGGGAGGGCRTAAELGREGRQAATASSRSSSSSSSSSPPGTTAKPESSAMGSPASGAMPAASACASRADAAVSAA
jgi:protein tyrosine phosphatase (PTP) superfamily phosphohydrolase (DUF442 family)